ncbi:glycosyltransferase family 4 protein [Bordetella sp. 02P26C-1]|uniref:glycosyltransferase family 4 protein n=1 Tax=Bordetella sp. 02P26C-1 TaxID=2683195 RepID=UPI0013536876|nr:glycosyltransferase family 4 protein [Bordetella sp. 02P26C-1]MVW77971.1 glycosyltransferase [Bordetella sp. 02P26C-1]
MKILLLVSSMHAGGAERVAATLVNAWTERGDTVTLVPTYSSKGTCFYPVSDAVNLIWLADRAGTRQGGPLAAWTRLRALRQLIIEQKPDVVVSFLTNVNVAAILATKVLGKLDVPLIVCERTNPVAETTTGRVWSQARRFLYPKADMVTVQADDTVGPFSRQVPGMRRLEVIPNPLPPALLDAPLVDAQAETPRKRLLAMGRLVPAKQFDLLIDVFAQLATAYPDWDLWIWGEGPDRDSLRARVESAGLVDRIQLPGRTDAPWEALSGGHAFVLSSAVEGFPNVLLESMALGLPCVAFDCPSGPREMTRDGQDAILVPAGDRDKLRDGMRRVMADATLRHSLGLRAAQSVRDRYALPAVLAQWDRLFETVRGKA